MCAEKRLQDVPVEQVHDAHGLLPHAPFATFTLFEDFALKWAPKEFGYLYGPPAAQYGQRPKTTTATGRACSNSFRVSSCRKAARPTIPSSIKVQVRKSVGWRRPVQHLQVGSGAAVL